MTRDEARRRFKALQEKHDFQGELDVRTDFPFVIGDAYISSGKIDAIAAAFDGAEIELWGGACDTCGYGDTLRINVRLDG